jgi:hypothetical protein
MWSIRETVKTPQLFSCSHPPTKTLNRRRTSTQPFSFCCTPLPLAKPDQSGDQYRSRMPFQLLDLSISSPTKGIILLPIKHSLKFPSQLAPPSGMDQAEKGRKNQKDNLNSLWSLLVRHQSVISSYARRFCNSAKLLRGNS